MQGIISSRSHRRWAPARQGRPSEFVFQRGNDKTNLMYLYVPLTKEIRGAMFCCLTVFIYLCGEVSKKGRQFRGKEMNVSKVQKI